MPYSWPLIEHQRNMGWDLCVGGLKLVGMRLMTTEESTLLTASIRRAIFYMLLGFVTAPILLILSSSWQFTNGRLLSTVSSCTLFIASFVAACLAFNQFISFSNLRIIQRHGYIYQFQGWLPDRRHWTSQHRKIARLAMTMSQPLGEFFVECFADGRIVRIQGLSAHGLFRRLSIRRFAPIPQAEGVRERSLTPTEKSELQTYRNNGLGLIASLVMPFFIIVCVTFPMRVGFKPEDVYLITLMTLGFGLAAIPQIRTWRRHSRMLKAARHALKSGRIEYNFDGRKVYLSESDALWSIDGQPAYWRYELP
ncbi:MAG: hypothetical protein KF784_04285 [Fimbriimonadaceae bacterium]|nr:hypothetical protein [Fimbriimonadaceae bacterium]